MLFFEKCVFISRSYENTIKVECYSFIALFQLNIFFFKNAESYTIEKQLGKLK